MATHDSPNGFQSEILFAYFVIQSKPLKPTPTTNTEKIHHIISCVFVGHSSLLGKVMELFCEKAEKTNYWGKNDSVSLSIILQINSN